MPIFTTTSDSSGNFSLNFDKPFVGGESISVTSTKLGQSKTIYLNAPSQAVDPNPPSEGGLIRFTGTLDNFPQNIGGIILDFPTDAPYSVGDFAFQVSSIDVFYARATSLEINGNVVSIGEQSFRDWRYATSITLPNSLQTIGTYSLSYFEKATSLVIPNSVVSIAVGGVRDWVVAKTLYLGNRVQSIDYAAFSGWRQAISLSIPPSVNTISDNAFYNWSSATSLTLPDNQTLTIGSSSFGNWTSCQEVLCLSSVPYDVDQYAFYGLPSSCVIKVPSASLNAYKTAPNWSQYASQMIGF